MIVRRSKVRIEHERLLGFRNSLIILCACDSNQNLKRQEAANMHKHIRCLFVFEERRVVSEFLRLLQCNNRVLLR